MTTSQQIAQHLRAVYFGGNWTAVNVRDTLKDVTWQQAITPIGNLNTIVTLLFHCNYYINGVLQLLQGGSLDIRDKYSFDPPEIASAEDWQKYQEQVWAEVEAFAGAIEQLPDSLLETTFVEEKYGTYYRNLQGIVEHTHYHLGQMVLLKKLLAEGDFSIS